MNHITTMVCWICHLFVCHIFLVLHIFTQTLLLCVCWNQSIETLQSFKLRAHSYLADPNFNPTFPKPPGKSRETNKRADKAFCVVVIIPPLLPLYLSWGSSSSVFPSLVGEMLSWNKKNPDVISNFPHSASLSRTSPPYLESWYSKTRSPIISTRRNNSDLKFCTIYWMCCCLDCLSFGIY